MGAERNGKVVWCQAESLTYLECGRRTNSSGSGDTATVVARCWWAVANSLTPPSTDSNILHPPQPHHRIHSIRYGICLQEPAKSKTSHQTTGAITRPPHPSAACKSAFAYFSGDCEKWVACKREARGETPLTLKSKLQLNSKLKKLKLK